MFGLLFFIFAVSAPAATLPTTKTIRPRPTHTVIEIADSSSLITPASMAEIGNGAQFRPPNDAAKYEHAQKKHKKKKKKESAKEESDGELLSDVPFLSGTTAAQAILILIGIDLGAFILFFVVWQLIFGGKPRSQGGKRDPKSFAGDMDPIGLCTCAVNFSCLNKIETMMCCPYMLAENMQKLRNPDQRPPRAVGTFLHSLLIWLSLHLTAFIGPLYFALSQRLHLLKYPYPDDSSASLPIEICKLICCPGCAIGQQSEFIEVYDEYYLGKTRFGRTPKGEELLGRSLMAKQYDAAQMSQYNNASEAYMAQSQAYSHLSAEEKLAYSQATHPDTPPSQVTDMVEDQQAQLQQQQEWDAMTPEQQQYYLQFQQQWAQMTEEERIYYMQQQELWAQMSPEEQQQQQMLHQQQMMMEQQQQQGWFA